MYKSQRAGGINKCTDGAAELFGLLHQAQGFAVALRAGHTEVVLQVALQIAALAVADDRDRLALVQGHAAQNAGVLSALAVALLFKKVGEQGVDVGVDLGPVGVPGQKHPILGGQGLAAGQQVGPAAGEVGPCLLYTSRCV